MKARPGTSMCWWRVTELPDAGSTLIEPDSLGRAVYFLGDPVMLAPANEADRYI
jgi:hypothetical protein